MKKKVLFVIPYMHEGGAEKVLSTIENNFSEDWEIDTLVNSDLDQAYPVKGRLISLGIDKEPKTSSVWFQFKVFIKRVKRLRKLKKTGGYESCIGFMDSANIANIISGNKYCRVVLSVHISLIRAAESLQYRLIVNPLVRFFYNQADTIVVVADGIKNELVNHFGIKENKIKVIYNGIDKKELEEKAGNISDKEYLEFIANKKVIFNMGRLTYQKSQWNLLRAFKYVSEKCHDAVLVIAGSGEYEEKLKKLAEVLGISDRVWFLGFVLNPYQYEKYADIFVLPSRHEGYPVALAEALCMGLPCLVTDFETGSREIIAPELLGQKEKITSVYEASNGLMVPVCTEDFELNSEIGPQEKLLAEAMVVMLTDKEKNEHYRERAREISGDLEIGRTIDEWMMVAER